MGDWIISSKGKASSSLRDEGIGNLPSAPVRPVNVQWYFDVRMRETVDGFILLFMKPNFLLPLQMPRYKEKEGM